MTYGYVPDSPDPRDDASGLGRWALTAVCYLALCITLVLLQLFQITAEGPAQRAHRRAAAALTEADTLIDRQYDDLQARAQAIQPGETVRLEDYPLAIDLQKAEVLGTTRDQIEALVLDRSANLLYEDGTASLRRETAGSPGRFSVGGFTDAGLDLLRERNHILLGVASAVAAAISLILALVLAGARGAGPRLVAPAGAFLAASLTLLIAGAGARGLTDAMSHNEAEYTQRELLSIAEQLAWIPIRNGIALSALAAVVLIAVFATSRLSRTGRMREQSGRGVSA